MANDPLIDFTPGPNYGQTVTIRKDLIEEGAIPGGTPLEIYVAGAPTIAQEDAEAEAIEYASSFLAQPIAVTNRSHPGFVDVKISGKLPNSQDGVQGPTFERRVRDALEFALSLDLTSGGGGSVYVTDLSGAGVAGTVTNEGGTYSPDTFAIVHESAQEAVQAEAAFIGNAASSVGSVVKGAASGLLSGLGWIGWAILAVIVLALFFILYLRFA